MYLLVKIKSVPPIAWTPDMMSDLVDAVNKFGTKWKRIKKEYKFTATVRALESKWRYSKEHQHIALKNGKWKVAPGNYNWSTYYTLLQEPIMRKHNYYSYYERESPTHLIKTVQESYCYCYIATPLIIMAIE